MHEATLRTVGGSVMVAIPKTILDLLGLQPNAKVGLSVENGRLVIEPSPRPRCSLAELVAQCDLNALVSRDDQEWLDAPPGGREAI